jgi:hypothetical protein
MPLPVGASLLRVCTVAVIVGSKALERSHAQEGSPWYYPTIRKRSGHRVALHNNERGLTFTGRLQPESHLHFVLFQKISGEKAGGEKTRKKCGALSRDEACAVIWWVQHGYRGGRVETKRPGKGPDKAQLGKGHVR